MIGHVNVHCIMKMMAPLKVIGGLKEEQKYIWPLPDTHGRK